MELLPMSQKELSRVEVLERLKAKKMRQKKGAEALGLSVRQVRRLQKKYAQKGAAGLIDQGRGKPSNNRLSFETRQQAIDLLDSLYADFGPTFAHEKLVEKHDLVLSSGLRWISMILLVNIPWAKRIWALPFLTVLAPSERYYENSARKHKKITDWARQMGKQVRRWLPKRKIVLVADSSYAALELLNSLLTLPKPVYMITQLRLDAALYEPAPERTAKTMGRPRKKGKRLPTPIPSPKIA